MLLEIYQHNRDDFGHMHRCKFLVPDTRAPIHRQS